MRCEVYLGLGSNMGARADNLRLGLRALRPDVQVAVVSSLYETAPVGVTDQPLFLNAVCLAQTDLDPEALLDRLKAAERARGRVPGPVWGPRPLDLDILLYGDSLVRSERLQIPHARLRERGFVLRPLADLAPTLQVPGGVHSVAELLATAGEDGVVWVAGPQWWSG